MCPLRLHIWKDGTIIKWFETWFFLFISENYLLWLLLQTGTKSNVKDMIRAQQILCEWMSHKHGYIASQALNDWLIWYDALCQILRVKIESWLRDCNFFQKTTCTTVALISSLQSGFLTFSYMFTIYEFNYNISSS